MVKVSDTAPKMAISFAPASTYRSNTEEIMTERKDNKKARKFYNHPLITQPTVNKLLLIQL
jgi:hypothetical protein